MSWGVFWSERAADELRRLARVDPQQVRRVGQAVTRLAETGHGDLRKLQATTDEWRLRVGNWRVRFRYDLEAGAIVVTRIAPRGRAYRD